MLELVHRTGKLPVVNFAAGGVATPADAALMHLGSEGIFVGSGIFKSECPDIFARAIVAATTHYTDYVLIASVSKNLGTAMKGIELSTLQPSELMAQRMLVVVLLVVIDSFHTSTLK